MAGEFILIPGAAFTVVMVNRFGQALNRDGTPFLLVDAGQRPFSMRFDDMEAARSFCEAAVRDTPHVECNVFDASGAEVLCLYDEAWLRAEDERIHQLFADSRQRTRRVWAMIIATAVAIVVGVGWWVRR